MSRPLYQPDACRDAPAAPEGGLFFRQLAVLAAIAWRVAHASNGVNNDLVIKTSEKSGEGPEHCTRELFHRHSLRCTRQRMAIYEALRNSQSHPTAEALYKIVKPQTDRLSLATVYNTLDALCQAGLVRKLPTTNGCCRYDAETSPHLHVRCLETGEIVDVPEDLGDELIHGLPQDVLHRIEKAMNVKIDRVHMQIMARKR